MTKWTPVHECEVYEGIFYVALDGDGEVCERAGHHGTVYYATHLLTNEFGDPIETPHPMKRFPYDD